MWLAIGRATAQQVRVGARLTIRTTNRPIATKLALRPAPVIPSGIRVAAVFARGFAAAGRPKKTKAATSKVANGKKPAAKKAAAKKTAKKANSPAAKKPKRTRAKKLVTDEEKAKLQLRELKKTALLKEEPTRLPITSWTVYTTQRVKELLKAGSDVTKLGSVVPALAQDYKALSAEELDKLRATAQQNKVANEAVLRDWIQSRTVREIYEANLARHYLRRKFGIAKSTFDDPRYPARPVNSWAAFVKSRYHGVSEAGDLNQQTKMVKLAQEWKQLSAEERKPFEEIAETEAARYKKEMEAYRKQADLE